MADVMAGFAHLYGKPTATGYLKTIPEHFKVSENLGFEPSGQGEHLFIRIRKTGENTRFVANELAKFCGVKSRDVSWAGLKDRHAVTEQWLSIYLPKADDIDFSLFSAKYPQVEVLAVTRHNKKLRPGELESNDFELVIDRVTDLADVESRLDELARHGVPNYFGSQRFGNEGSNVEEARRWGRENVRSRNANQRSTYLSAARSWIFNQIVSKRIEQNIFTTQIEGDILDPNGPCLITAALAGDNALPTQADALKLEQECVDGEPDLMTLIRGNRMQQDRRAIVLHPQNLSWDRGEDSIAIRFTLPAGSFATVVVRELVQELVVERTYD